MGSTAPIVGRREESAHLDRLLISGPRHLACVEVSGEAGIGKSTLVRACADRWRERGVAVVTGNCLRQAGELPFLPFIDALRSLNHIARESLLENAIGTCPPFVRVELTRLLPELELNSAPFSGQPWDAMSRFRLFDGVRQVLSAVASRTSAVIVIEDMHWADPSTVELYDYLLSPGHVTGVGLVVTYRPEDTDPEWTVAGLTRADVARVDLGPLSRAETAEQAAILRGARLEPSDADDLYVRTGGHPFYTDQLLTARVDLRGSTVPSGLRAVLLTKVGRAEPEERALLDVLAVAGRGLDEAELSHVHGASEVHTRNGLRALINRGLVDVRGDRYGLRHALLGEAILSDLLPGDLRAVHLSLAREMATTDDATLAGEIAGHFASAGSSGDELGWRIRAAAHADSVLAAGDASRHWLRSVELLTTVGEDHWAGWDASGLYLRAAWAFEHLGDTVRAGDLAEHALACMDAAAPPVDRARLLRVVGHWRAVNDPAAGEAALREAAYLYRTLPASRDKAYTLFRLSQLLFHQRGSDDLEQRSLLAEARDAANGCGAVGVQRLLASSIATARMLDGDLGGALAAADAAAAIGSDVSDPHTSVGAAVGITEVLLKCGRFDQVVELGQRELTWADQNGYPAAFVALVLRSNIAEALRETGKVSQARDMIASAPPGAHRRLLAIQEAFMQCLGGRTDQAAAMWASYREELPRSAHLFQREYALLGVEILIWAGHAVGAAEDAVGVLEDAAPTDVSRFCGGLLVLALRACADEAGDARAAGDAERCADAIRMGERIERVRRQCRREPFDTDVPATARGDGRAWDAEWSRLQGQWEPALSSSAADAWLYAGMPIRAAYARYREAEALLADPRSRSAATSVLRDAAALGDGHVPLMTAIAALSDRARIDLSGPAPAPASPPAVPVPFGLTNREMAVLRELSAGRTNAEIARVLYISASTVGVHVSNILRKMRVTSRVQAAATATRIGVTDQPPYPPVTEPSRRPPVREPR